MTINNTLSFKKEGTYTDRSRSLIKITVSGNLYILDVKLITQGNKGKQLTHRLKNYIAKQLIREVLA